MITTVLSRVADLVRGQDWWLYKIPPLLAAGYATVLLFPLDTARAAAILLAVLVAICLVASFGYLINDLFDVEQDRRSGRRNRMASMPAGRRVLWCSAPVVLAFATLVAVEMPPGVLGLLGLNLLLPVLYSIPPFRFKERGALGVIADAGAAHLLPTALMVTALTPRDQLFSTRWWILLTATCVWSSCAGLRGIIVHQVLDQRADAAAGVETFGGRLGARRARVLTYRGIVPLEVAAVLVFVVLVVSSAPVLGVLTGIYVAGEVLKIRAGWILPLFEPAGESAERYVPLMNNEWYELWLPLALAVQLSWIDPVFLALLAFQTLAFWPNLQARGGVLRRLVLATLPHRGR